MKHLAWVFLLFFALFAPLGCGQADSTPAPAPSPERVASTKQALTTIGNMPSNSSICCFGGTTSYGQVITVPAVDTVLSSFSVEMVSVPATRIFRAEVYEWNGSAVTGPNLYESGPTATTGPTKQTITFDTGGVGLTAGAKYILFVTMAKDAGSGNGAMGSRSDDAYAGGEFHWGIGPPSSWTDPNAWGVCCGPDLAFTATFTAAATTTTTIATSATPSVFGQPVTLTATVTGGTPTGTVTFRDGPTTLGTGTVNGSGQASLTTAALAVGAHSITAAYGGGGGSGPSTSRPGPSPAPS